jgi:hypothetical protein
MHEFTTSFMYYIHLASLYKKLSESNSTFSKPDLPHFNLNNDRTPVVGRRSWSLAALIWQGEITPESVHSSPHPSSRDKASPQFHHHAPLLCFRPLAYISHDLASWRNKAMLILPVSTKQYSSFRLRYSRIPRENAAIV